MSKEVEPVLKSDKAKLDLSERNQHALHQEAVKDLSSRPKQSSKNDKNDGSGAVLPKINEPSKELGNDIFEAEKGKLFKIRVEKSDLEKSLSVPPLQSDEYRPFDARKKNDQSLPKTKEQNK